MSPAHARGELNVPRTKKPELASQPLSPPPGGDGTVSEVMTLSEAAAYLRLSEEEVVRLVHDQDLPGRLAGTEWRFLKPAIQEWLSKPLPRPSKEAQLAVAGLWQGDPYVEEELKEIYKRRGRPTTEDEP
jgi:excisionase family DNA binding protein